MEEERQILIDVEIESKNFDEEIGQINTQLKENQETIKELNKDYKANATEIARVQAANKKLSETKRDLIKESNTESNSLNALRLKLAQLTKERNAADTSTENGRKAFQRLQKEILNTTTELKGFEEESGDFRRNVGNYTNSIKEAIVGNTGFGKSIVGINNTLKVNPFLLIVSAIALIVDGIKKITPLMDGLNAVFLPITTVIERIIGLLQNGLLAAIEGFKTGGIIGAVKAFGGAFEGAGDQIREAANQGRRLAELAIEIDESQIRLVKTQAQLKKEIAEQKFIAEDVTKTTKERIAAAEKALQLEEQIEQIRVDNIKLQLEEANLKAAQNDTDRATRLEIAQLEAELSQAEAERFERTKDINNRINSLRLEETKKLQEAEKKRLEEARKQQEEFIKLYEEGLGAEVKAADEASKYKLSLNKKELQEKIKANKEQIKATEDRIKFEQAQEAALAAYKEQLGQQSLANLAYTFEQGSILGKTFALTSIGYDTGKAISALVANSEANPGNAVTFGGAGILQFIAGITRIGANIAQAKNILNNPNASPSGGGGGGGSRAPVNIPTSEGGLNNVNASLLGQFGDGARNQAAQTNSLARSMQGMNIQVAVTDINKGQRARQVKVTESSLG